MSILNRLSGCVAAMGLAMTIAGTAPASAAVVSLFGDIDGFGGQVAPGAIGADTGFNFDNRTGSDPALTDAWLYEQDGLEAGSPINYDHSYSLGGDTAVSAILNIMESGMSDGRGPWNVLFNGNLAGQIANGGETITALHSFIIDVSWLTGLLDTVTLVYLDTVGEGFAIDYSELVIQTRVSAVPVPAALPLLATGLGILAYASRRRKAKAAA